jgi:2,3-bisphosphoglycerate-independent phosphoglycerate mutase
MKYAIVIPDGCADEPIAELGDRTPLEAAHLPTMDAVARAGRVGQARHTPESLPAGSEVANLSLLGYDPLEYFTGRAPLEAAAQGIQLGPADWAVRCNLVTVIDQVMVDFTAGHIGSDEARQLLASLQAAIGHPQIEFHGGVSYRNLMLLRGDIGRPPPFSVDTRTRAPHDLTDLSVADDFPRGPGSDLLVEIMSRSLSTFQDHPVNQQRMATGRAVATGVWLWGLGRTPQLPQFSDRFGLRGAMITAVDLLRGIAALVGWPRIEVPGATGYLDTDYGAKGRAAVAAMRDYDVVCVHIEAPDEASHEGRADAKIEALEQIDRHIVAPIWESLQSLGPHRLLISPDHPTPCRTKKHTHGLVPFAMAGTGIVADAAIAYDERQAAAGDVRFDPGWPLMEVFLRG